MKEADDTLSVIETECAGLPAVFVVSETAIRSADRGHFPWHLVVFIDAVELAERGMPTRAETLVLDDVGDHIEAEITKDRSQLPNSIFLARSTWNQRRELHYRVHDPEVANAVLQGLLREPAKREWSFELRHDPPWGSASFVSDLLSRALS